MDLFKDNFRQHYASKRTLKPARRRRRYTYSKNTTVGRRSKKGMIAALSISAAALAALVLVAIFVVIPAITNATTPVAAPPTATPVNKHPADMTKLQKEILMRYTNNGNTVAIPNASIPNANGHEIVFSSGKDAIGAIRFSNIFVFDTANPDNGLQRVLSDALKNDNILEPCIDENRIVWFDAKNGGGGTIYAYDRKTQATTAIKTSYFGLPKLNLYQNYIAWIEYAGTKDATMVDKLYIYDLVSGESTALELFRNSPAGTSAAYIDGTGNLIWATVKPTGDDVTDTEENKPVTCIINSAKLGEANAQIKRYDPGMYVHNPMSNGTATIWTDTNGVPASALWASIGGQAPEKIADGTTQYGIGKDFAAYTKDQTLYLYFFEDKRTCKLGEDAQLGSVNGNTVVWFKVGQDISQSIVKYAVIDN